MATIHEVKAVHDSILNHIHKIRMKIDPEYAKDAEARFRETFGSIFGGAR